MEDIFIINQTGSLAKPMVFYIRKYKQRSPFWQEQPSERQVMTPEVITPTETYPWFAKRRNISLLVLSFFLLLAAASLFLSYKHFQETKQRTLRDDRRAAGLYAMILEEHFQRIVKTMESYTNRPLLIQAVQQKNPEKARKHLINLTRNNPDIDSMIITDREGTVWVSQPLRQEVMGIHFAYRDWYQEVSRQWNPYISDAVLRIAGEKDKAIHVAVPIFDEKGKVIGILQNTQRAVRLVKIIQRATLAANTSISVIDRKGRIIFSTRYAYEKELLPYPFHEMIQGPQTGRYQSFAVVEPFAGGSKRYLSSAAVTGVGWRVFVERDRRSILSESSAYFIQMAAIFVLLFLTISLLLLYFRKRVIVQRTLDHLRIENALLASETRFRELFDHMSSGAAVYEAMGNGEDFIISDLNAAGRRITGVAGDVIGRKIRDVFPGVEDFGLFEVFRRVWRSGAAESHPNAMYQDGRLTFWAENYVCKLPSGQIVAIFDDITKRMSAEKVLRESEHRYRLLFDEMISGYALHEIICDPSGKPVDYRFLSVNRAFETMTGLSAGDIIGKTILEILPATEPIWIERYGKVALTGEPAQFENYSQEMKKYFEVRAFRPEARKFATLFNDITERRKAEEEIKRLHAQMERRIIERTAELSAKTKELERLNRVFVDRELRMRELKAKIEELEKHHA